MAQATSYDREPVNYQSAPVDDEIARLLKRLDSGETKLEFDEPHGYLKSLLNELEIPISSQVLVFSKTSLQNHKITPRRPRAIYYNDEVYVGYVQRGDVVEIGSTDPRQGAIFYVLKQQEGKGPELLRDQGQCMVCHASSRTQNVPGYLMRSVFPSRSGHPNFGSGTYLTESSSPMRERWGGWYVTGTHGTMQHMGNKLYKSSQRGDLDRGANLTTLEGLVSTEPYLSDHSDIVSLMVLTHQTQMHNAITFANFETREALHQNRSLNEILEREEDYLSDSTRSRIQSAATRVVEHLLMCDEMALTDPIKGTSSFTDDFQRNGKRDSQQRSLRDLDLKSRLFKFPCSYLIYSPSFDSLPDEVRQLVVSELHDVLNGTNQSDQFSHLDAKTRTAILEILKETKPDLFSTAH